MRQFDKAPGNRRQGDTACSGAQCAPRGTGHQARVGRPPVPFMGRPLAAAKPSPWGEGVSAQAVGSDAHIAPVIASGNDASSAKKRAKKVGSQWPLTSAAIMPINALRAMADVVIGHYRRRAAERLQRDVKMIRSIALYTGGGLGSARPTQALSYSGSRRAAVFCGLRAGFPYI